MHRRKPLTIATTTLMAALIAVGLLPSTPSDRARASTMPAPQGVAHPLKIDSFEPTMGATSNGDLYFSVTPETFVAGWTASVARSTDGGRRWKDVGPRAAGQTLPVETNDPYIYVDPATDRVFTFHMSPILTCAVINYSDDAGKTWTTNPAGCSPTGVWDHQTMVASKPRQTPTIGYPNVLHQCVNAVYALTCSRSLNGGLVWEPSRVVYANDRLVQGGYGAQTGHLTAAPDGTVYLPTTVGATAPTVFITRDDGNTWTKSVIAKMDVPFIDPSVSVDRKGNVYAVWVDKKGFLYYATSRNTGKSWSKPVRIANGWTANMPVAVADGVGRVAIAYPATNDLSDGYATKGYGTGGDPKLLSKVTWGGNISITTNGLSGRPSFKTFVTTGSDPIGRGAICLASTRCEFLVDFIEAVIGPDGVPYAAFIDGCTGDCAKSSSTPNDTGTGMGVLGKVVGAPDLCDGRCWRYGKADKGMLLSLLTEPMSAEEMEVAESHTLDALSPELRRLYEQATAERVEAVLNR